MSNFSYVIFLVDPSKELKKSLGEMLRVKGIMVGENVDLSSVRVVVSDPSPYLFVGENDFNNVGAYLEALSSIRTSFVPIVFYSEATEKEINNRGFLKCSHYDIYFSKLEDSLQDVSQYIRYKISLGNPILDFLN